MQEYSGIAINVSLMEMEDETLMAFAELIVLVSEPFYSADAAGQLIRQRSMSQIRFGVSSKTIRELIKRLTTYADGMDELQARASIKPEA